ncbi:MAG: helix-turn-helix transcriptional regulator [Muribaculaceae bacterium]|nr:helix-turn-helix transcriptional regulator [Muribaculaceae bacterium]
MDKDTFKKEIGFRIKVERMRKKISQEKLAEMADCSLSYIGFVERGEMSLSLYNFLKISSVLGLNTNDILKDLDVIK